eukprot:951478-Amorphochlora_amoeboformis.AAC.2
MVPDGSLSGTGILFGSRVPKRPLLDGSIQGLTSWEERVEDGGKYHASCGNEQGICGSLVDSQVSTKVKKHFSDTASDPGSVLGKRLRRVRLTRRWLKAPAGSKECKPTVRSKVSSLPGKLTHSGILTRDVNPTVTFI